MRNILITTTLVIATLVACKKTTTTATATDCSGSNKSFSSDVKLIISSSCATGSSCHGTGSTRGCGALTTYTEIYANRNSVSSSVSSGRMPLGSTLTSTQKNNIICWVNQGAANN
ncbi:MAG: hypothetical protein RJA07_2581 [Bacteroidota bacterium]|jgi:hypothetical protein